MDVRTFAEAMRAVSAAASRELPAVLETVASQAESLLDCRGVGIDLAEGFGDGLRFRRARIPAFAASLGAGELPTWTPRPEYLRRLEAGEVVWEGDFRSGLAPALLAERPWLGEVGSRLSAPLLADDDLIGVLTAVWSEPGRASPEQLQIAEALGRAAAVAVRTARLIQSQRVLLQERERARRELEAVLDAASDSVIVYRADGRLVQANRVARQRFVDRIGELPSSLDEFVARARPTAPGGQPLARTPAQRALDGETADGVLSYADADGRQRRFHVHAAPMVDPDGRVQAAVVVSRDITELEEAIADRGRLDGAVKTARLVAHQLNTKLAIVIGNAEMLRADLDGPDAELADDVLQGADDAARIVARLQQLIRFEETEMAGIAMLDLDAATTGS